jgi:hypothetical protein
MCGRARLSTDVSDDALRAAFGFAMFAPEHKRELLTWLMPPGTCARKPIARRSNSRAIKR